MAEHDSHKSYRPFTIASFRLDWYLGGGQHNPFVYHCVNIVLNGVATAAVSYLSFHLYSGAGAALTAAIAGVLFAVHPVHVEAVAGLVSRADILTTICFIGGFIHYTSRDDKAGGTLSPTFWLKFAAWLYTAALFKEIGFFLVAVCGIWELGRMPLDWNRAVPRGLLLGAIALPYLLLRSSLSSATGGLSLTSSTLEHSELIRKAENPFAFLSGLPRVLSLNYLQAKYAELLLFPTTLCCEYSFNCIPAVESFSDPRNLGSLVLDIVMVLLLLYCYRNRAGAVAACVALTIIPYLPAANLFFRIGAHS